MLKTGIYVLILILEVFALLKPCGHYEIAFSQFQTKFQKIKKNETTGCIFEDVSNGEKHFRFRG